MISEPVIQLCEGRVWHRRLRPFKHPFNYPVFCMRLRMDQRAAVDQQNSWLFGINRWRPISFHDSDHGYRDMRSLEQWLDETLERVNVKHPRGAVWLQTFPRVLGYVFNPVSFWYLHDQQGQLRVIVAEVNNTFGQHHCYVLVSPDQSPISTDTELFCKKVFHVSPFCPVKGVYRFKRGVQGLSESMVIDYFDDDKCEQPLLETGISVVPRAYRKMSLLRTFLRMPLLTIGVMVRIHWQALKLWRAGAKFHRLPSLPDNEVTSNQGRSL